ncbi:hypothetical protein SISSUDRAFT_995281, partial [Sistotremastrum suecicum HHB10207 ss-3]
MSVSQRDWDTVSQQIATLTPDVIQSVADHIENEGNTQGLSTEQKRVLTLLKRVNTISSHLPGSQACKVKARNDIRGYMGYFGLTHVFLTMNTNAHHCPVFHVMFGDQAVDLSSRFPIMASSDERAWRLNRDPVAAADFFEFMCEMFLEHMCAWDSRTRKSKTGGGIMGNLRAYFGVSEFTDRAQLHGHFLIWLEGGLNPSDLHRRLETDTEFSTRFF